MPVNSPLKAQYKSLCMRLLMLMAVELCLISLGVAQYSSTEVSLTTLYVLLTLVNVVKVGRQRCVGHMMRLWMPSLYKR